MSMERCDIHGAWDSDNYETCPHCRLDNSETRIQELEHELATAQAKLAALLETHASLRADYTKVRNECDSLRADAERYRWLRNIPGNEQMLAALENACAEPDSPEAFDAAIDAARKL